MTNSFYSVLIAFTLISSSLHASSIVKLKTGWKLFPASAAYKPGAKVPSTAKSTSVPKTVVAALVENKVYENPYFGKNIEKINPKDFEQSYWYVNDFEFNKATDEFVNLKLEGVNYKANVYLNGKLIADTSQIKGVYKIFKLNISNELKKKNTLAIEVFPPRAGDFTIGFVDWAPVPADKNMGLWREVSLEVSKAVAISNTFVYSVLDSTTYKSAKLYANAELQNFTASALETEVKIELLNGIVVKVPAGLKPYEKRKVYFSADKYKELQIANPQLWWPAQLGKPVLHQLKSSVSINNQVSDSEQITFGIREVKDYFTPEGARGYKINGKPILIKGAGWVDQLFLENTPEYDEAQVKYVQDMGLNCIRFEGFWGTSKNIYELCDKYGLLAMVGFSCQWEWHDYIRGKTFDESEEGHGAIQTKEDMKLVSEYFYDMTLWLRNNPSVFVWLGGSDRLLKPELEEKVLAIMKSENPSALFCGAAKMKSSKISGSTGVKMEGPYDYVPPIYWYTDTKRGGAFGFNTETGPGPQPHVFESAKKYLPKENYWPIDTNMWNFHSGRHAFGNMDRYVKPLNDRYGKMNNLEEFSAWAQVQNYELMRPMFESFILNQPKTTGIVQWMLNSAWPDTYWQLYDFFLYPTGAYFGCKKANQTILPAYHYGNNKVYLNNQNWNNYTDLQVDITLLNSNSKVIFFKSVTTDLLPNEQKELVLIPNHQDENEVYFLSIQVKNKVKQTLADNFYWLSNKKDEMENDYEKSSWIYTPTVSNGNFNYLRNLPKATINSSITELSADSVYRNFEITVSNKEENIAFFGENILRNPQTKEWIVPLLWSDNYISLLPNETKKLIVRFYKNLIPKEQLPLFEVKFLNQK